MRSPRRRFWVGSGLSLVAALAFGSALAHCTYAFDPAVLERASDAGLGSDVPGVDGTAEARASNDGGPPGADAADAADASVWYPLDAACMPSLTCSCTASRQCETDCCCSVFLSDAYVDDCDNKVNCRDLNGCLPF
jgi:hypothetical protein